MSRSNIASSGFLVGGAAFYVTFDLKAGGSRTYIYSGSDGKAISGGADPKDFAGQLLPIESPTGQQLVIFASELFL